METSFVIVFTILFALFERYYSQSCGELPKVSNLDPITPGDPPYDLETVVRYRCSRGYVRLDGTDSAVCRRLNSNSDPEWVLPTLRCTGISCGDPGESPHAYKIGTLYTFPNNVTYKCHEGYRLIGNRPILFCLPSGNWAADVPDCRIISCGELPGIANGYVRYEPNDQNYGSEAEYICNGGFKLNGTIRKECLSNGSWSGVGEPSCETARCSSHSDLPYGRIIHSDTKVGALAIFQCDAEGSLPYTMKCQADGTWSREPPVCPPTRTTATPAKETKTSAPTSSATPELKTPGPVGGKSLCEDPGPIENGFIEGKVAFPTNQSLSFRCADGFSLKGTPTLACLSNGIWSPQTLPRCQKRLSMEMIAGIVVGVVSLLILLAVGIIFYLKNRKRRLAAADTPGNKNKAQSMDAKHVDEIRYLDRDKKKPIPVTSL